MTEVIGNMQQAAPCLQVSQARGAEPASRHQADGEGREDDQSPEPCFDWALCLLAPTLEPTLRNLS